MGMSLPEPVGRQREVVYLREWGHTVVLGVAGSGKTLMAAHRARYLSEAPVIGGPTLLVTFNAVLATYLKQLLGKDAESPLSISTYHKFAGDHLRERHGAPSGKNHPNGRNNLISKARSEVLARHPDSEAAARPLRFHVNEVDWITGQGITDSATYIERTLPRAGSEDSVSMEDRVVLFEVYDRFRELRDERGGPHFWADMASAVREELETSAEERPYRHVVIDEGQDFTPEMVRSLAAAVPDDGSLTFFGDYAQLTYGSRASWLSLGLRAPGVVEFDRNYRTTRQTALLAKALAATPGFRGEAELIDPVLPEREGPQPLVIDTSAATANGGARGEGPRGEGPQSGEAWGGEARGGEEERGEEAGVEDAHLGEVARLARERADGGGQVAILLRTREHAQRVRQALLAEGVHKPRQLHRSMTRWQEGPGVWFGTYAASKGMEFDSVVLPFCDEGAHPPAADVEAYGTVAATAREARLLHLGVTRARTEVVLLHTGRLARLLTVALDEGTPGRTVGEAA